jgi:hypothetical protein
MSPEVKVLLACLLFLLIIIIFVAVIDPITSSIASFFEKRRRLAHIAKYKRQQEPSFIQWVQENYRCQHTYQGVPSCANWSPSYIPTLADYYTADFHYWGSPWWGQRMPPSYLNYCESCKKRFCYIHFNPQKRMCGNCVSHNQIQEYNSFLSSFRYTYRCHETSCNHQSTTPVPSFADYCANGPTWPVPTDMKKCSSCRNFICLPHAKVARNGVCARCHLNAAIWREQAEVTRKEELAAKQKAYEVELSSWHARITCHGCNDYVRMPDPSFEDFCRTGFSWPDPKDLRSCEQCYARICDTCYASSRKCSSCKHKEFMESFRPHNPAFVHNCFLQGKSGSSSHLVIPLGCSQRRMLLYSSRWKSQNLL